MKYLAWQSDVFSLANRWKTFLFLFLSALESFFGSKMGQIQMLTVALFSHFALCWEFSMRGCHLVYGAWHAIAIVCYWDLVTWASSFNSLANTWLFGWSLYRNIPLLDRAVNQGTRSFSRTMLHTYCFYNLYESKWYINIICFYK